MGRILIAGSYNASMTVTSPHLPRPGETVMGAGFQTGPGGKGANQAIGAKRLGGDVVFLVKLGADDLGDTAESLLLGEGLPASAITRTTSAGTGVALIMVDGQGNNQISVAPGANSQLTAADAPASLVHGVDVLLCQLECPPELFETLALALPAATRILNPAPAVGLSDGCCQLVDFLTPNETELATLTGLPVDTDDEVRAAAKQLLDRGVRNVVATVGNRGALWVTGEDTSIFRPPEVHVVDTTGAGDAFNAGLAVGLAQNLSVATSIELAVRCGAFCVTQAGVIGGLPRPDQLPV